MDERLDFEILNLDNVIAHVLYDYESRRLTVDNYGESYMDSTILGLAEPTMDSIYAWFEGRCFPRTRVDCDFLLKSIGLSEYAPYNIVRKTHGVLFDDRYWIRFIDEPHLKWVDVDPRQRSGSHVNK